ncbi:CU044_2847 family protein [Arthrobacter sp. QXT-31]|uniref:CU044_2847 family protein n=1 Tax=Arthrobacter sp. QXT-31 TaxID=1357915 RepID=UPI000971B677|nr:CU044_2847 family protein [Arthrobacter sp. QXT-31]APX01160.1 hypothetical protein BWQ92_04925 [Arthrobacter sp. QXT-31]
MPKTPIVEISMANGDVILSTAEVADPEQEVGDGKLVIKARELVAKLGPLASEIKESLTELTPDEMTVTLKVGLAIETGAVVAILGGGRVESGIEVAMTWSQG